MYNGIKKGVLAVLLNGSVMQLAFAHPAPSQPVSSLMYHNWTQIPQSTNLTWVPCFTNFTCARLTVPLDYDNEQNHSPNKNSTTSIAYLKYPATIKPDTAEDILWNPGGPGGSGVGWVLSGGGKVLQKKYGAQYNIVGFDPRGVNNSGPSLSNAHCLVDDGAKLSPERRRECRTLIREGEAQYIGTLAVAQDMLNYIKKRAQLLGRPTDEAKLWYSGGSYGSVIGHAFAYMFPDRIGRMILDGVVDSTKHWDGDWSHYVNRASEIMEQFPRRCHAAGPVRCRAYEDSPEKIRISLHKSFIKLQEASINSPIGILSRMYLHGVLFSGTYGPYNFFPELARMIDELRANDAQGFTKALIKGKNDKVFEEDHHAIIIISCLDAAGGEFGNDILKYHETVQWDKFIALNNPKFDPNKTELLDFPHESKNYSKPILGVDPERNAKDKCKDIPIAPPPSQRLPGRAWETLTHSKQFNTSYPILHISNTLDPVSPIEGSYAMQKHFPSSIILKQNSIGHCSGERSSCTMNYIREYLSGNFTSKSNTADAEGYVYDRRLYCEPDRQPFMDKNSLVLQWKDTLQARKYLNFTKGKDVKEILDITNLDGPASPAFEARERTNSRREASSAGRRATEPGPVMLFFGGAHSSAAVKQTQTISSLAFWVKVLPLICIGYYVWCEIGGWTSGRYFKDTVGIWLEDQTMNG